jgi:hypothetical protein
MAAGDYNGLAHDFIRVTVKGGAGGQEIINVFDFVSSEAPHRGGVNPGVVVQNSILALADFRDNWGFNVLPHLSDKYQVYSYEFHRYEQMFVRAVSPSGTWKTQFSFNTPTIIQGAASSDSGQVAGDPLPTFNAYSIRKLTTSGSRLARGSCRLGAVPEVNTLFQDVTVAERALINTDLAVFLARGMIGGGVGSVPHVFAVLSPRSYLRTLTWASGFTIAPSWVSTANGAIGTPAPAGDVWSPVQQMLCNRHLGRQVSRQIRRDFA